ncbi:Two-component system sensor histidine kinase [Synechococcus sp. RCC307]|nr:Two-component system sensor histidine kinase [Synechococcus sp. RCC307]
MSPLLPFGRPQQHWSIARRFFYAALVLIVFQSLGSIVISNQLWRHYTSRALNQIVTRNLDRPLNHVDNQLDSLTAEEAINCCSQKDYQKLLQGLVLFDNKMLMIDGSAGLVALQGAQRIYTREQLESYAKLVRNSPDRFAISGWGTPQAVAIKSVKLTGGEQTGSLIFVRPIYNMALYGTLNRVKTISELVLMVSLWVLLAACLLLIFRPIRHLRTKFSGIQLDDLDSASISLEKQPIELLPILSEFNHMVSRLEQAATNQKQFASTISHEFRTPLTVVSGFIQSVLNRADDLKPQFRDALTVANQEALRLNRMLSDLLDLSRADNRQLRILQEPFAIKAACLQSLKLARAAFTNPITDQLAQVEEVEAIGDHDRLVQCLENLIGNAVKYSEPDRPIALDLQVDNFEVAVTVVDQGQGIANDQLERIFERFQRAEGVTLRQGQSSSGLGLSIVKMLVDGMGGSITVHSVPGEGSRFTIRLKRFL